MDILSADFEVFGTVQGVFFRKFTKLQAEKLELKGWCMNTDKGSVQGHLEGAPSNVQNMMTWLKETGSPQSKIETAEFKNVKNIKEFTCNKFSILH